MFYTTTIICRSHDEIVHVILTQFVNRENYIIYTVSDRLKL